MSNKCERSYYYPVQSKSQTSFLEAGIYWCSAADAPLNGLLEEKRGSAADDFKTGNENGMSRLDNHRISKVKPDVNQAGFFQTERALKPVYLVWLDDHDALSLVPFEISCALHHMHVAAPMLGFPCIKLVR